MEEKTALTPKPPPPPAAEVADEKKKLTFRRSDSEEEALEMNGFEHEVSKMGGNEGGSRIINDFDDVSAHGMNRSNESEKFVEKLSTYEPEPEEEEAVDIDIASHISCSGSAEEVKGRIIIPSLAFQRSRSNPTTLKHTATSKDYTVDIDPLPCFAAAASATTTQLENYKTRFVSGSSSFLPERAQVRPTRLPQQRRYESYFSEEHKTTKVFDLDACLLAGIESSGEEKVKSSTAAAGSLVDTGTGMFLPLTSS